MSKTVIFGITGYAGTHIATELVDRGHDVVGIARTPDSGPLPGAHLERRSGSVYDPEVLNDVPEEYLAEAEAHDRVLTALQTAGTEVDWFYVSPPPGFGRHNPGTKTGTFRLGTDTLISGPAGNAETSGADFAIAFVDEIEKPAHHQMRFTLGY